MGPPLAPGTGDVDTGGGGVEVGLDADVKEVDMVRSLQKTKVSWQLYIARASRT